MNQTTKEARIKSNLSQIATLQAEKARVQDGWLARGIEKTTEMVDAISEQIVNLYEEIDAIEAGETKAPALATEKDDEQGVTRTEVEMMKRFGWTVADLRRNKVKMGRRIGCRV